MTRAARVRDDLRACVATATCDAVAGRGRVEITADFPSARDVRRFVAVLAVGGGAAIADARGWVVGGRAMSAWACALGVILLARALVRPRRSVATFDRAVGAQCETFDALGRGVASRRFVPRERARGLTVLERVSTADVWYQLVCSTEEDGDGVTFFDGFRCSGGMMRLAVEVGRRCLDLE